MTFDVDSVEAGISDDPDADVSGTVVATITPKESADRVWFESSDESIATVVEEGREETGDSVVVTLKVYGVSPSEEEGDVDLEALYQSNDSSEEERRFRASRSGNHNVVARISVTILAPKTQAQTYDPPTAENTYARVSGVIWLKTRAFTTVHIQIFDQFGKPLSSIYDGPLHVYETFTLKQQPHNWLRPPDDYIRVPTGDLKDGKIDDLVALETGGPMSIQMTDAELQQWVNFQYIIPGTNANNTFAADPKDYWYLWVSQHLKVHGWDLTNDYQREQLVIKTNVREDILDFNLW